MLCNIYVNSLAKVVLRFGPCHHQDADDTQLCFSFSYELDEASDALTRCSEIIKVGGETYQTEAQSNKTEVC